MLQPTRTLKSQVKHSNASTPQFIKSIEYQIGNSNQGRFELFWHFNVLTSTKTSPQENILRLNVMSYFFQKINNSWNHAQKWQLAILLFIKQKWYFPTLFQYKKVWRVFPIIEKCEKLLHWIKLFLLQYLFTVLCDILSNIIL